MLPTIFMKSTEGSRWSHAWFRKRFWVLCCYVEVRLCQLRGCFKVFGFWEDHSGSLHMGEGNTSLTQATSRAAGLLMIIAVDIMLARMRIRV